MTQDEIIRMAREACAPNQTFNSDEEWVERFAALVAAHERENRTKELMQLFLDPENQPTQFGTATLEYREEEMAAAYARGHNEGGKDFEAIVLPAVISAEREACAKVCEENWDSINNLGEDEYQTGRGRGSLDCAAVIRARGDNK